MHYKEKKISPSNLSLFHSNIQLLYANETSLSHCKRGLLSNKIAVKD